MSPSPCICRTQGAQAETLRAWRMGETEYCQERTRYTHRPFLALTYENHVKPRQYFPKLKKKEREKRSYRLLRFFMTFYSVVWTFHFHFDNKVAILFFFTILMM